MQYSTATLQVCLHDACNSHVLLLNILFCYRDEVFSVSWLVSGKGAQQQINLILNTWVSTLDHISL